MDNTDRKKRVILINKRVNHLTGETVVRTKPKNPQRKKIIVAEGKGKKTIGNILLSRLYPFGFAINTGLIKRGYNVSGLNFKSKVAIYYNEFATGIIGRKPLNVSEFINNVSFKLTPDDEINGDIEETRNQVQFAEITSVVNDIIEVFKVAKFKYETLKIQGFEPRQFLTDEQLTQAKAAFIVQDRLTKNLQSDHFFQSGEVWGLVKIIVGIYLIYYILKSIT